MPNTPITAPSDAAGQPPLHAGRGARSGYPSLVYWIALCATAEMIGMTASAAAARLAADFGGGWALALVVVGGLVEGTALGVLQAVGLRRWLPGLKRGRWIAMTVVVAGLGWAAAAAPSQLQQESDPGPEPQLWLVIAGGAALGVAMGSVLGLAQAVALRGVVTHPFRWTAVSAIAWPPTMAIIFLGATTPDDTWPFVSVLLLGAATGALAGAMLGLISGLLMPAVDGGSISRRVVLGILASPAHGLFGRSLIGIRFRGRRSGRMIELPAQCAPVRDGWVVYPAHPERKQWWRNFRRKRDLEVLTSGGWEPARGHLSRPGDADRALALTAYRTRWPRVEVRDDAPLVVLSRADTDRSRVPGVTAEGTVDA